jgi:hypothetical protein
VSACCGLNCALLSEAAIGVRQPVFSSKWFISNVVLHEFLFAASMFRSAISYRLLGVALDAALAWPLHFSWETAGIPSSPRPLVCLGHW